MSQMMTRKSAVSEEKEKRTDSPVKDMKKKVAANAEKEKQAAEKPTEKQPDKTEKPKQADKPAEKNDKPKQPEKPSEKDKQKQPEKLTEKPKQAEKAAEKEKPAEKSMDKKIEKNGVDKKTDKKDTQEKKDEKAEKIAKDAKKNGEKSKQNGSKHNGVDSNGVEDATSDDDVLEIADDEFPELAYDDTSDNESPTPDNAPGRSATRRSQVKAARTPETPQPAAPAHSAPPADKQADGTAADQEPKDKVLKLAEAPPSDRKLRSDDPKPDKKEDKKKEEDNKKKDEDAKKKEEDTKMNGEKDNGEVIEIDADEEPRKTDTNYSKSRVKVSPYRRSTRLADQTNTSVMANYTGTPSVNGAPQPTAGDTIQGSAKVAQVVLTPIALVPPYYSAWLDQSGSQALVDTGNNTTMEMDITASSSFAEDLSGLDDSSYLSGLRSIRGRRSYKPLKELAIKHVNRSNRSAANISVSESSTRPTGTVVGRKRKPDCDESVSAGTSESDAGELSTAVHTKRMRLLDRIAQPFRRTLASTPLPARRNPEIVGINTDLPLTAPVATPSTFDPESLKTPPAVTVTPPTPGADDMDKKRCIVM